MILKEITDVHIYGEFSDTSISLLFVAIFFVYLRKIPYNTNMNAYTYIDSRNKTERTFSPKPPDKTF